MNTTWKLHSIHYITTIFVSFVICSVLTLQKSQVILQFMTGHANLISLSAFIEVRLIRIIWFYTVNPILMKLNDGLMHIYPYKKGGDAKSFYVITFLCQTKTIWRLQGLILDLYFRWTCFIIRKSFYINSKVS